MFSRIKFYVNNIGSSNQGGYANAYSALLDCFGDVQVKNNRGRVLAEFWGL